MLLASNVARSYFQLVRLNEQVTLARRTLAQREETLKLVQDRVSADLDTRLELRQSEGGLPEARLQLESLQEQMTLTRNALGALIGQSNIALAAIPRAQDAIKTAQAGMIMVPVGLLALLLSPVVGKNIHKVDPRRLAAVAFITFALVLWMRSNFNTQADFGTILIPTVIQGVAMAFFFIPLLTLTLSGLSPDRIPAASGLSNFVRIVAGSFGTSIATTIWQDRAAMHHAHLSEAVNTGSTATNSALSGLASAGLTPDQALGTVNRLVDQQAYMLAASDVFYASELVFLALIPLVFLAKNIKSKAGGGDAGGGAH